MIKTDGNAEDLSIPFKIWAYFCINFIIATILIIFWVKVLLNYNAKRVYRIYARIAFSLLLVCALTKLIGSIFIIVNNELTTWTNECNPGGLFLCPSSLPKNFDTKIPKTLFPFPKIGGIFICIGFYIEYACYLLLMLNVHSRLLRICVLDSEMIHKLCYYLFLTIEFVLVTIQFIYPFYYFISDSIEIDVESTLNSKYVCYFSTLNRA